MAGTSAPRDGVTGRADGINGLFIDDDSRKPHTYRMADDSGRHEPSALSLTSRMSLARTRLSFERTLMSWVRTAASLVTFGFTLAKANQYLVEHGGTPSHRILGLHTFALLIVAIGLLALFGACLQHLRHVKTLHALASELPIVSIGQVVAVLFAILGAAAFLELL